MFHWLKIENIYSYTVVGTDDDELKNCLTMEVEVQPTETSGGEQANPSSNDVFPSTIDLVNRGERMRLTKVASIYSANAVGKSNFFKAFDSMIHNITDKRTDLLGERFLLDYRLDNKPIYCEVCFSLPTPGTKNKFTAYRYGYELTTTGDGKADSVLSEWLEMRGLDEHGDFAKLFRRNGNEVTFDENKLDTDTIRVLENPNSKTLVLNLVGYVTGVNISEPLVSVFGWCNSIRFYQSELFRKIDSKLFERTIKLIKDNKDNFADELKKFLIGFDDTIVDVRVGDNEDKSKEDRGKIEVGRERLGANGRKEICYFPITTQESHGIQRIIGAYHYFRDALRKGQLLLCDELDLALNSEVIRDIVNIFNRKSNNEGAQLIFSSHSLVVLNKKDVLPEEIYFIEKSSDGKSTIYPASGELKYLKEQLKNERNIDFSDLYLLGEFGAVPMNNLYI